MMRFERRFTVGRRSWSRLGANAALVAGLLQSVPAASADEPETPEMASVPDAPTVPDALKARVEKMTAVVTKIGEHCQESGDRNGGEYDERHCPGWFAKLKSSDEAVQYAIGEVALEKVSEGDIDWSMANGSWSSLVEILGQSRSPLAATYLVRAMGGNAPSGFAGYQDNLETLVNATREATGMDVAMIPSWGLGDTEFDFQPVADAWVSWYEAHAKEAPEVWRAAGLEASRAGLTSTDLSVRYTAIERQLSAGGDRAAALASLRAALSNPKVTAGFVDATSQFKTRFQVSPEFLAETEKARDNADPGAPAPEVALPPPAVATPPDLKKLLARCTNAFYGLRLEASLKACSAAVALAPDNLDALVGRGWAQLELGKTKEAHATANAALAKGGSGGANQLLAAILTVEGDNKAAKALLEGAASTSADARQRLTLLSGQPPSATWVRYVAPRYVCWLERGPQEAAAFLLRRGFTDSKAFTNAWQALPEAERTTLSDRGRGLCPWLTAASGQPSGGQ